MRRLPVLALGGLRGDLVQRGTTYHTWNNFQTRTDNYTNIYKAHYHSLIRSRLLPVAPLAGWIAVHARTRDLAPTNGTVVFHQVAIFGFFRRIGQRRTFAAVFFRYTLQIDPLQHVVANLVGAPEDVNLLQR